MPPKKSYSREDILKVAFEVIRQNGFGYLSARSIADILQSSTQPIYSYLSSMDTVVAELQQMVNAEQIKYQTKAYTDNPFLNMAIGYVEFAQKEKKLFRFLFYDRPIQVTNEFKDNLLKQVQEFLPKDISLETFLIVPETTMNRMALKGWIFTHGLACMLNSEFIPEMSIEEVTRLITEQGLANLDFEMKYNQPDQKIK